MIAFDEEAKRKGLFSELVRMTSDFDKFIRDFHAGIFGVGGTWTPTLTNVTNVAASTAHLCAFMSRNQIVGFGGLVQINATAAGSVILRMTPPIPSNFTDTADCSGNGTSPGANPIVVSIIPALATDELDFRYTAPAGGNAFIRFVGFYVRK